MIKKFKFKGWDWTELADAFQLTVHLQDGDNYHELAEYIFKNAYDEGLKNKRDRIIEKTCRQFLKQLIKAGKKINYAHPLWKGLSEIEDTETFLKYFSHLVGSMWT